MGRPEYRAERGTGSILEAIAQPELVAELESGNVVADAGTFEVLDRATQAIGKYLSELLDGIPDQPLRLAAVLSVDLDAMPFSVDALFFESALPADGRVHSVDVRDVAVAFAAATTADVVGEILLIGGDESHLLRQEEIGKSLA